MLPDVHIAIQTYTSPTSRLWSAPPTTPTASLQVPGSEFQDEACRYEPTAPDTSHARTISTQRVSMLRRRTLPLALAVSGDVAAYKDVKAPFAESYDRRP